MTPKLGSARLAAAGLISTFFVGVFGQTGAAPCRWAERQHPHRSGDRLWHAHRRRRNAWRRHRLRQRLVRHSLRRPVRPLAHRPCPSERPARRKVERRPSGAALRADGIPYPGRDHRARQPQRRRRRGDRLYAPSWWLGATTHFGWSGYDVSTGADVVIVGPQTGIKPIHSEIHQFFGNNPINLSSADQLSNGIYLDAHAEGRARHRAQLRRGAPLRGTAPPVPRRWPGSVWT